MTPLDAELLRQKWQCINNPDITLGAAIHHEMTCPFCQSLQSIMQAHAASQDYRWQRGPVPACSPAEREAVAEAAAIRDPSFRDIADTETESHPTHPVDDRRRMAPEPLYRCPAMYGPAAWGLQCSWLRAHAGTHRVWRTGVEWEAETP